MKPEDLTGGELVRYLDEDGVDHTSLVLLASVVGHARGWAVDLADGMVLMVDADENVELAGTEERGERYARVLAALNADAALSELPYLVLMRVLRGLLEAVR